jgi:hypothetical protein
MEAPRWCGGYSLFCPIALNIMDMPTLKQVCLPCLEWKGEGCLPDSTRDFQRFIDNSGSPHVTFTTECAISINNRTTVSGISVYPVPITDILYINSTEDISELAFYDLSGKLFLNKQINGYIKAVDVSGLKSGIYIVQLKYEDKIYREKVIKD